MSKSTGSSAFGDRSSKFSEAIDLVEMEGLTVTDATRADAREFAAGRISTDELRARARSRYGLDVTSFD